MDLPIKELILGCPKMKELNLYAWAVEGTLCGLGLDYDPIDYDGSTIIIRNIREPEKKEE